MADQQPGGAVGGGIGGADWAANNGANLKAIRGDPQIAPQNFDPVAFQQQQQDDMAAF